MNELNSQARELLDDARCAPLEPPPSVRRRMKQGVLAALVPAGALAAAPLLKLVLVGVVAALAGSGVTAWLLRRSDAPVQVEALVTTLDAAPAIEPPQAIEPVAHAAPEPRPPVASRQKQILPPAPAPATSSSLAEELAALNDALAAVEGRRWADAEAALAHFHAEFPHAALNVEAQSLMVRTLCGQARAEEASHLADTLRREQPRNPSVQRLSTTCAAP